MRALSTKKRHKLRIRAKNLRYAVEFFAGVFPGEETAKRREAALAALKELQDQLGALNDLAQREALVADGHDLADHAHGLLGAERGRRGTAARPRPKSARGLRRGEILLEIVPRGRPFRADGHRRRAPGKAA